MISSNITHLAQDVFPPGYNYTPFVFSPNDTLQGIIANGTQHFLSNGTITKSSRAPPKVPPIYLISFYTYPVLLVVGLLSNILAYLVFTRTHFRKVPSVPYLAAMAVVDSGALVTDFIQNGLVQHKINIIGLSGMCQYVTYFNFVFIFLGIWYPVALCVEKFIGVYCPLRKATLCTPFRAKVVVIGMAIMAGTCYYYVIYMTGPITMNNKTVICREWRELRFDFYILMKLDVVFVSVLPTFVLLLLVSLICFRGYEYYRISSAVELSGRAGPTRSASSRGSVRVTNVIFPVVFIMLILKVPLGFLRFFVMVSGSFVQYAPELQPVFLYVSRFEWAIKLHVYLIFSPNFRRRTLSYISSIAFIRSKLTGRYDRSSSEEPEEGVPRIQLAERIEQGANTRACLMSSDV
ncbi:uncharacterized protein LOC106072300 [Biomphalaria glabrata]|uniref:Uncharacterized protein LOC106072300 n=1 Tax=Biomphalaria glabrata TaxID=6526 RepID=A0A9W3ASJ0_BIOGL|nr:uncharacterized protein LOC106072300 [Biomphalaria glabrata]XP_055890180.1 uncharacterized protein LOC106072300 [Biomphalaria glabrata]XP_055890181.1 uncharacterized protein LOC106072300 [Biomphalaria glabrata]